MHTHGNLSRTEAEAKGGNPWYLPMGCISGIVSTGFELMTVGGDWLITLSFISLRAIMISRPVESRHVRKVVLSL